MKISQAGLELIKQFEGFSPTVYTCPAGKPTVGYGHVVRQGENFRHAINQEMANNLLARDVGWAETFIDGHHLTLAQHEFDALVSFVFNVGSGNFTTSTLRRKLMAGDRAGVAEEFLRWNKAGKRVLPGLTRRRQAEQAMFLGVARAG